MRTQYYHAAHVQQQSLEDDEQLARRLQNEEYDWESVEDAPPNDTGERYIRPYLKPPEDYSDEEEEIQEQRQSSRGAVEQLREAEAEDEDTLGLGKGLSAGINRRLRTHQPENTVAESEARERLSDVLNTNFEVAQRTALPV